MWQIQKDQISYSTEKKYPQRSPSIYPWSGALVYRIYSYIFYEKILCWDLKIIVINSVYLTTYFPTLGFSIAVKVKVAAKLIKHVAL